MFEAIQKFISSFQTKQQAPIEAVKSISYPGWSFLGQGINSCGNAVIGLSTMYEILKTNKMAGAYHQKISNMVARYGFAIYDQDGEMVTNRKAKEMLQISNSLFKAGYGDNRTRHSFVTLFFQQLFASGETTIVADGLNGLFKADPVNGYMKVLDTRGIKKEFDKYGNISHYEYNYDGKRIDREKFLPEMAVNYIGYPNPDSPTQGLSIFNRIYVEALTNREANNRQFYFFKNNAVPNVVVMFDTEDVEDPKIAIEGFMARRDEKFRGSSNASKPLGSDIVKDVKQLDVSNVDMDFINLRKENDKDFAFIFLLDTRLVGGSKENGSYSEIDSTTRKQGNDQIEAYATMFEDAINIAYKKFVDETAEFKIKCVNAYFTDDVQEKEMGLKEVAAGVMTPNEYIVEHRQGKASSQEGMNKYRLAPEPVQQPTKE